MKLITKLIYKRLRENYAANDKRSVAGESPEDFNPVVKFFNPCGSGTWLITEMDENNIMFGLCDLGLGTPELGDVSLDELKSYRGQFGLGIERDLHFKANLTLSQYTDEAMAKERIVA